MAQAHTFDPTILREYDIRGIVGETLSTDDANAIGRAYGTILVRDGGKKVAVGRDGRLSSPEMAQALADGLASTGLEVADIGRCPTPQLYFAVHHLEADGGIMVTGSHNPPDYNGFKMMFGTGPFFGDDIQKLGALAAAGDFVEADGDIRQTDTHDAYLDRLMQDYGGKRQLSVVWDCGNGAAGPVVRDICTRLPSSHSVLYIEVDGTFPNHHPDPSVPENLADLITTIRDGGADVGIAFDGDGDRIGLVDDEGEMLFGDQLLMLLAEDVLKTHPGATIIGDVKASQVLYEHVAAHGGTPLMWRTGHSLIKVKMKEVDSPLAGEMSGHVFFRDRYYGFDDALYAAVRVLEILANRDEKLSDWRKRLPDLYNTPEIRIDCADTKKFGAIDAVKAHLAAQDGVEVSEVDGVRVNTAYGWWLLRASNTQAVLVARCESTSSEGLDRLKGDLRSALVAADVAVPAL